MHKFKLIPFAALAGACALVSFTTLNPGLVAAQSAQQPTQVLKQFGPRKEKPAGAAAQPAQGPAAQAAEVVGKHGDWTVTCEKKEVKQPDGTTKKPCALIQSTTSAERKNVALTLVLIKSQKDGKPNTMMRVIAPIGVFLPTGVALEIDGAAVGRVPFTRCLPQVCIAFAEASPPTLEKMKKGGKANFIIYEAPGLGMSLELSLKGFTAGLKNLHQL
ncbi:MAG: invasion associated locus B family protein [Hyphomicrobiales bacterium]|nr:invasion associated locus B family protein [Hyphomicrobiales bacterium]